MQVLKANAGVESCPSHKSRWRASGCCSAELDIIKQVKGARTPIVPESLRLRGTTCQLEGVAHGTSTQPIKVQYVFILLRIANYRFIICKSSM